MRAFFALGSLIPFHAAATGIAYLSALNDTEIAKVLTSTLTPRTNETMTDRGEVLDAVNDARVRGFSVNSSGFASGIASVGAALFGQGPTPVGALSISGPASRLTPEKQLAFGPLVMKAAQAVSQRLSD